MESGVAGDVLGASVVPVEDAQRELDRLLADPAFRTPERNKSFLRFAANEYFGGRAESVKAYTIAVDVFGRPSTFDPTLDPIVRIEATRLRTALSQYYDSRPEGACVRIDLPKGRYVPVFSPICTEQPATAPTLLDRIRNRGTVASANTDRRLWLTPALAIVTVTALVTCAGAIGFWLPQSGVWSPPVWTDKPIVTVDMKVPNDATGANAQFVHDGIMVALSQFQTFRLASATEDRPVVYTSSIGNTTNSRSHPYRVTLKYAEEGGDASVWWRVTDDATGEVLRSGVEHGGGAQFGMTGEQALAAKVAIRLAGRRGAINDVEMSKELTAPSLGNGCVLWAQAAVQSHDQAQKSSAADCLRATLAVSATSSDANAMQAMLMASADPTEALAIATRAVRLAPSSDRAQLAQSLVLFEAGRMDAAIAAGYRAMSLNPANSAVMAKLGLMVFLSGKWAEGVALARKSEALETEDSPDAIVTLALEAYRTGRYEDALRNVAQLAETDNGTVNVLTAAARGQLGNPTEAGATLNITGADPAKLEAYFQTMRARQYAPSLIDALEAGLSKAVEREN
ncbi:hypothetical protein [Rhizobium sp. RAF56]|jgi:tetratricopeptide (TPR) repeat protein|uniref:hypothetical protein n=1 Tax=Rhizobium sp. RAF56 TaxID=3233062 RepID=UPI003F9A75C6